MTTTTAVPVYSPLPAYTADPQEAVRAYQAFMRRWDAGEHMRVRDTFPTLPWTMHEIEGTTWHNLHSAREITIERLVLDRWSQPQPAAAGERPRDCLYRLGFWSGPRFVIEHYVRVDHLPVEARLAWLRFGVAREMARHGESLRRLARAPRGRILEVGAEDQHLATAREMLRAFCREHDLAVTPKLLNAGVTCEDFSGSVPTVPIQMALL